MKIKPDAEQCIAAVASKSWQLRLCGALVAIRSGKMKTVKLIFLVFILFKSAIGKSQNMEKHKILNHSREYSLYTYDEETNDPLPKKYRDKGSFGEAENGLIGTIELEFMHPDGFELAILKIDGFENRYHVIAKDALGGVNDNVIDMPKIEWYNLPDSTFEQNLILKGKVITEGNINRFEINRSNIGVNKNNEFEFPIELGPDKNEIRFYISTDINTTTYDYVYIKNQKPIHEEVYKDLVSNNLLPGITKIENQEEIEERIKSSLKSGYFYPSESFNKYFDIEGEYLVEDGFNHALTNILTSIEAWGVSSQIGEEFQKYNDEIKSESGESHWDHWIIVDNEKEVIFEGFLGNSDFYTAYLNKLVEIVNKVLKRNSKSERVHLITSYDGVLLSILTNEEYLKLEEICKPLKNTRFIK